MSFRFKLLIAMMTVVAAVSCASLALAQRRLQAAQSALFQQRAEMQAELTSRLQSARLRAIQVRCARLGGDPRIRGVLRAYLRVAPEDDYRTELARRIYLQVKDQLLDFIKPSLEGDSGVGAYASFFRLFDITGASIPLPEDFETGDTGASEERQDGGWGALEAIARQVEAQEAGSLAVGAGEDVPQLFEVTLTPIFDADGTRLGLILVAFPPPGERLGRSGGTGALEGMLTQGHFFPLGQGWPAELRQLIEEHFANEELRQFPEGMRLAAGGESYSVFLRQVARESALPPVHQISAYSLAEAISEQRQLRASVLGLGAISLCGALLVSLFLAQGLTRPVQDLERASEEIKAGNFAVRLQPRSRDELGRLSIAFNEMAEGLAQKEQYRSVLNMVADKDVAEELMRGEVTLGGEIRDATILFCDIRGFTSITQEMDPREVIEMLNEHMTALTEVIYQRHGVVDKFVGDAIMAIFGAPKTYGDDALNAVQSGLEMVRKRQELNGASKFKLEIGVGIASGSVVAGCMGSRDRLNYTVLGQRVNLASRLCGCAGRMEVVVDEETRRRLGPSFPATPAPPVTLKGFSNPEPVFRLAVNHDGSEKQNHA